MCVESLWNLLDVWDFELGVSTEGTFDGSRIQQDERSLFHDVSSFLLISRASKPTCCGVWMARPSKIPN